LLAHVEVARLDLALRAFDAARDHLGLDGLAVGHLQALHDGAHPITGEGTLSQQITATLVESLGYLLPALDQWTATSWLVDAVPEPVVLLGILLQGLVYLALLTTAALFDFHRRSL
jgi:hypothetical protein